MDTIGFIYLTTNKVNGMKYIGKCIYARQNNWQSYLGSGVYLKRAIKKYGKENFERVILQEATSIEELNMLEEKYIEEYGAVENINFYNLKKTAIGGDIFTYHPDKEKIRKKRIQQMSGMGNHQYGKPKSKKMIESVKAVNSRQIIIDGVKYVSLTDASKVLKIGITTILYRLDSKNFPNYIRLDKKNDPKNYTPHTPTKQLEIDGVIYNGYKDAMNKLKIAKSTLAYRLNSENFPNYKRIQQS